MKNLKRALLEEPVKLVALLERYDFCKVVIHTTYVSCARGLDGSPKSIVIRLEHNDYLWVTDYPLNLKMDLIAYIIQQRKVLFVEVLNVIKEILGIDKYCGEIHNKKEVFGGFYSKIKKHKQNLVQVYSENILNQYKSNGNLRFFKDGINFSTQKKFNIGYCQSEMAITIPIYDVYGQLIGIKARTNQEYIEGSKYFYLIPCNMSQTLYGYSQNYDVLNDGEIYIYESEKSVMQCDSMSINNCVAIGSSSLSNKQASLIASLQPNKVVLLHDEGLEKEIIERNIDILKPYLRFLNTEIYYWDSTLDIDIPPKSSLSDLGKERLLYGLQNELVEVT